MLKLPPYIKKLLLILLVMLASYLTLLAVIHHSKELAKTDSEATQSINNN